MQATRASLQLHYKFHRDQMCTGVVCQWQCESCLEFSLAVNRGLARLSQCQTHKKNKHRQGETQKDITHIHTDTHTAWGSREAWQPPQCWSEAESCSRKWLPLLHHLCTGLSSMHHSVWGCTQGELCCYLSYCLRVNRNIYPMAISVQVTGSNKKS